MRKWILAAVIVAAVVGGWYAYTRYSEAQKQSAAAAAAAVSNETDEMSNIIWASGKLQPREWAGLGPVVGGVVSDIHVAEGDSVKAGDLLLELDSAVLAAQVDIARGALAEASAARDRMTAGATDAEKAQAEAAVAEAQSAVQLAAGRLQEAQAAIDTAQAQVEIAQRQYAEAASHPTTDEATAAAARVAVAQSAVEQAQAAYNIVKGDPNIGALPQSGALRAATAALEAARAESASVTSGPSQESLGVLSAQIGAAQAGVEAAQSQLPSAEAAVQAALAQQASAQASLDDLLAGATAEDIASADAAVSSAEAAVASALANVQQARIRAPFAGEVGQVNVRKGEVITPGQQVILLGDTTNLHVQTTDLRENDVVRLHEGMPVEVTFDALPDAKFKGAIERIAPVSSAAQGSTNYTIDVSVDGLEPSLRWGMTAFVNIQADTPAPGASTPDATPAGDQSDQ